MRDRIDPFVQLELLPSKQVRRGREYAIGFKDLTPTAAPAATAAGPCAGKERYYATSLFTAQVARVTSSKTGGGRYRSVRLTLHVTNTTNEPLVLGYMAKSGDVIDDRGRIESVAAQCSLHALGDRSEKGSSAGGGIEDAVPAPIRARLFEKVQKPVNQRGRGKEYPVLGPDGSGKKTRVKRAQQEPRDRRWQLCGCFTKRVPQFALQVIGRRLD